jgi:hypothetical protein
MQARALVQTIIDIRRTAWRVLAIATSSSHHARFAVSNERVGKLCGELRCEVENGLSDLWSCTDLGHKFWIPVMYVECEVRGCAGE